MDRKPENDVYTIGQISQLLNVKEHTIRFWEKEFPIVKPVRKSNGRREYSRQDFFLLQQIKKLLYEEGYTAKGALKELMSYSELEKDSLVVHEEADLFYESERILPVDLKQDKISSQSQKAQNVAYANQSSSRGLQSFHNGSLEIEKKIDQVVWTKFYEKITDLIDYLEKD